MVRVLSHNIRHDLLGGEPVVGDWLELVCNKWEEVVMALPSEQVLGNEGLDE